MDVPVALLIAFGASTAATLWPRQAVYSTPFFAFWGCAALASGLTAALSQGEP